LQSWRAMAWFLHPNVPNRCTRNYARKSSARG
jgi:hypothetical protein